MGEQSDTQKAAQGRSSTAKAIRGTGRSSTTRKAAQSTNKTNVANRSVFVFGGGKVGLNLARALRRASYVVTLRAARKGLPKKRIEADVVIVAVRDGDIPRVATALAEKGLVGHRRVAIFHCAGALTAEALSPARRALVSVGQLHPMISFASPTFLPSLERGQLLVDGDPAAVSVGRTIGKRLGMTARTITGLDRVAYHAAAGLVANGAAALAAGGMFLLGAAGVDAKTATKMLGPLLRSVAENVEQLGLPNALTGPVRRGDALAVAKHLATIGRLAPHLSDFYAAAANAQLPLARALHEAPAEAFDAIENALKRGN